MTDIFWKRGKVLTLMALLKFYGDRFCQACGVLGQSRTLLNVVGGVDHQQLGILGSNLGDLQRQCAQMELSMASRRIQRFLDTLDATGGTAWGEISRQLTDIYQTVVDELETRTLLCLSPDSAVFYTGRNLFGPEVSNAFRPATIDIEEAGKCLALSRGTACVFHLMRVMETGLRAMSKSLADPRIDPARNPSWEMILKKCDEERTKPIMERMPEWRSDHAFFSIATANLRAVKDAWRNPTMHVERVYTDETALEVWNAVRAFMRYLPTKLSVA